ncbi:hypothetical protein ACFSX5_13660 [Devosia albogilva]|uniref:Alkaline proteinase inhibitor/ Outer membrane lipoprotein Omp19 domain-containing protein n=1 Tax=Devosia albogilva TaxID=429726 RepID=A0ABW5QMV6_9HYPH
MKKVVWATAAVLSLTLNGGALAQAEADFVAAFAGDWQVVDDLYGVDGKTCSITLSDEGTDGVYGLTSSNCNLELSGLTGWRITEGQMVLLAGEQEVAALGGNQGRMSGNSAIGAPIILDRAGDNQLASEVTAALESSGCYYLGFTSVCADDAQLSKPKISNDGSPANISVLVNLNARVEARDDADVLGVVPAGSCIVTDICMDAADGAWCRASFGDQQGWLKKVALRQQTWPVITFVNQCTTASE